MRWPSCGRRWRHGNEPEAGGARGVQFATTHRGRRRACPARRRRDLVNHDDDRVGRDYRAASAALDERPAPSARAAILAAAAREVKARPREDTGSSAPRRSIQRWPLAAAAAVLLSTLVALLTVRTEREMPSFTAPAADQQTPPASPAVRSPPSVSGPAATPPAAVDATMLGAPATVQTPPSPDTPTAAVPPAAKPNASMLAKRAPSASVAAEMKASHDQPKATQEEARDAVAPEGRSRAKEEGVASSAAPAAGPAEPAASGAIDAKPASRAAAPPPAVAAEKQRQDRAERANAAPLREPSAGVPGAASSSASGQAAAAVESDASGGRSMRADDWLEKIIKLRREGRHAEADEELKLFRERFPQVRVPADALGPTGTR